MASTTSAAAYMLMTGSSTSTSSSSGPPGSHHQAATATAANPTTDHLYHPNAYTSLSDHHNLLTSRSRGQLFLPNSTLSPSPSQPTITLDLTSSTTSSQANSQLSRLMSSATFAHSRTNTSSSPFGSATNLTFNSSELTHPNPSARSNTTLPISWPPTGQLLNYDNNNSTSSSNNTAPNYNKTLGSAGPPLPSSMPGGVMDPIKQQQAVSMTLDHNPASFYQTFLQKVVSNPNPSNYQQPPQPADDTIAAAAKAITSDPNFRSVLTAAISSFITSNNAGSGGGDRTGNTGNILGQISKLWGDNNQLAGASTLLLQGGGGGSGGTKGTATTTTGCAASSFLNIAPNNNKSSSSTNNNSTNNIAHHHLQPVGNLMFQLPSPALQLAAAASNSKSTSTSPGDSRDHINS